MAGDVTRQESRDMNGVVRGFYDYLDPNGIVQHVEYIADQDGFRVRATNLPIHVAAVVKDKPQIATPE